MRRTSGGSLSSILTLMINSALLSVKLFLSDWVKSGQEGLVINSRGAVFESKAAQVSKHKVRTRSQNILRVLETYKTDQGQGNFLTADCEK